MRKVKIWDKLISYSVWSQIQTRQQVYCYKKEENAEARLPLAQNAVLREWILNVWQKHNYLKSFNTMTMSIFKQVTVLKSTFYASLANYCFNIFDWFWPLVVQENTKPLMCQHSCNWFYLQVPSKNEFWPSLGSLSKRNYCGVSGMTAVTHGGLIFYRHTVLINEPCDGTRTPSLPHSTPKLCFSPVH